MSPAQGSRSCPSERDEEDRDRPEEADPLDARRGQVGDVRAREEEPRAGGDEVEDTDEVVRRRVVGALLVVVVEALELCEDDEDGQRQDEQRVLEDRRDVGADAAGEDELRNDEGGSQAEHVGEKQHPPHEPAPPPDGRRSPTFDEVERPLVDELLEVGERTRKGACFVGGRHCSRSLSE